jgi:hypothetical protein
MIEEVFGTPNPYTMSVKNHVITIAEGSEEFPYSMDSE